MSPNETKVLRALQDNYSDHYAYCSFATLCAETRLERKIVRRACRSLARKGLAHFQSGLWTEDGTPAGSGYAAVPSAIAKLAAEVA